MPEVMVSADDVRSVIVALGGAAAAFTPYIAAVPGFTAAQEACVRMASAVENSGLPPDPVAGPDQAAIGHHVMMEAYERAGFSHEEAFAVLMAYIQAYATGSALRGGPHG